MSLIASALKLPSLALRRHRENREHPARDEPAPEVKSKSALGDALFEAVEAKPFLFSNVINRFLRAKAKTTGWQIPVIGRFPHNRQLQLLAIFIASFLLLTLATFGISIWDTRLKREQALVSNEMQVLSQRLAALAQQSAAGDAAAFRTLDETRARFLADLTLLADGGERNGIDLPAAGEDEVKELGVIMERWKPLDEQVTRLHQQQQNLVQLRKNEDVISRNGSKVFALAQRMLNGAIGKGEEYRAVAWAHQLYADISNYELLEAKTLVSTDRPNPQVALQLAVNVSNFTRTVKGLVEGNPEAGISALQHPANREVATALLKVIGEMKVAIDEIVRNMQDLARARQASRDITKGTDEILGKLAALTRTYGSSGTGWGGIGAGVVFTMLTLLGFALVAKVLLDDARVRALKNEQENRQNEQAILRLLDGMSHLAEGDLTKHAQVTEDMTGAIADAVNYAIDELRSLVAQMNAAAGQLTESSGQGRAVSAHLLQVAEKKSSQIQDASTSVLQMASTMESVSASAAKCAQVAEQSLAASGKGGVAVQDSIAGMNTLREQIQETSKRIKRLGESSQEIGEIVQLIAGITEQTNVLALNAAIQAAAAGEAGRGFTVVAEEVQRLAERSGEATKQISALVKTIQNDTQDAVAAMEQSTQGVVRGAYLADSAGRALEEIREVSHRLAELVATISSATLNQQMVAKQVAQRMQEILNVTSQTMKGTRWTAESMARIAELAQELKVSTSRFKI